MCVCARALVCFLMCMNAHAEAGVVRASGAEVQVVVRQLAWVLTSVLRSSARAACTLNL